MSEVPEAMAESGWTAQGDLHMGRLGVAEETVATSLVSTKMVGPESRLMGHTGIQVMTEQAFSVLRAATAQTGPSVAAEHLEAKVSQSKVARAATEETAATERNRVVMAVTAATGETAQVDEGGTRATAATATTFPDRPAPKVAAASAWEGTAELEGRVARPRISDRSLATMARVDSKARQVMEPAEPRVSREGLARSVRLSSP